MAHDVFVSHASTDRSAAESITAHLEFHGIRCWIAPRDVTAGMPYGRAIVQAIQNTRVLLLLLSNEANISHHILREVEQAASSKVPIVPLLIQDVKPSADLEFYLKPVHWLSAYAPPLERYYADLRSAILTHISGRNIESSRPPEQPEPDPETPRPVARSQLGAEIEVGPSPAGPARPHDRSRDPLSPLALAAYRVLRTRVRSKDPRIYDYDLVQALPHAFRRMARDESVLSDALSEITKACHAEGMPTLSSFVVHRSSNAPASAYFLQAHPQNAGDPNLRRIDWAREIDRANRTTYPESL